MLARFRDFIRAFSVRWFVAMSGGLGVPLTAAGIFFEPVVVKIIFFVTAVFCAVFSSFWIWNVEHEARLNTESKDNNQENRKNIRVALGRFLPAAGSLMDLCRNVTISPPNDDANAWGQQVEAFLLSNLDESYISRFRDGSNIMPLHPVGGLPQDHLNLWCSMRIRMVRLQEFIKELSI
jgi:hypothetical protein